MTNDIAEINGQNQFRILGRKDNTINTGGVKVQIEQVEAALKEHLSVPFLITSAPRRKFGEIIVLLAEGQLPDDIEQTCTHQLPPLLASQTFCSGIQTSPDRNRETRPCHSQITGAKITPIHS